MKVDSRTLIFGGFGALIAVFQIYQMLENGVDGSGWAIALLISAVLLYVAFKPVAQGRVADSEESREIANAQASFASACDQANAFLLYCVRNDFHPPKNIPMMGSYRTAQTANALHFVTGLFFYELGRQSISKDSLIGRTFLQMTIRRLSELRLEGVNSGIEAIKGQPGNRFTESQITDLNEAEEKVLEMFASAGVQANLDGHLQKLYELMNPWFGGKCIGEEADDRFGPISSDIIKELRPTISAR